MIIMIKRNFTILLFSRQFVFQHSFIIQSLKLSCFVIILGEETLVTL